MTRLDPSNPRHRGPNRRILAIALSALVAAVVVIGIWGLSATDDIDSTPMATNGPPGPGSIDAETDPTETGTVDTGAPDAVAPPPAAE